MNDTPDDPRLPEPGGGEDDTTPIEPAADPPAEMPAEMPAEPPYDSVELPPLAPLGDDLPPLDGDGDPPKRRLLSGGRLAVAAVLVLVLLGGAALAATSGGDDDSDDGTDGIASVDGSEGDDDSDDSSGSGDRPTEEEMQDAMLEYAECMRDNGIDMPDPEFSEDGGGFSVGARPGADGAPGSEEWEAAEEACGSIMEDVRGEMTPPSAEELAELEDKLLAMAQCMRDKGHDMPDPQVSGDGGGIEIAIGSDKPGEGGGPQPGEEDEWMADQDACSEEAGLEDGPGRLAPAGGDD